MYFLLHHRRQVLAKVYLAAIVDGTIKYGFHSKQSINMEVLGV